MVAPAFGWSAGDIVTSIKIIIRISKAFKEADGAVSQFAETTAFLDAFEATLRHIKEHTNENANAKYTDSIVEHVKVIDGPYSKFEKYMLDFCPALGEASTQSSVRKAPKKIKWAVKELSDVSGEVAKLKKAVVDPILFIGPLLLLQALASMEVVASHMSNLPSNTRLDSLMDAIEEAAVPSQLTQQVHVLHQTAQDHGSMLDALSQNLTKSHESLAQEVSKSHTTAIADNEILECGQIRRSTDILIRIENLRDEMIKKLDSMLNTFEEPEGLQSDRIQTFEKELGKQRHTLNQVHLLVKTSVGEIAKLLESTSIARDDADKPKRESSNRDWLGQVSGQLLTSGITSGMTALVVGLATQAGSLPSSTNLQRENDTPLQETSFATTTTPATTSKEEGSSKTKEARSSSASTTPGGSQHFERVWSSGCRQQGPRARPAAFPSRPDVYYRSAIRILPKYASATSSSRGAVSRQDLPKYASATSSSLGAVGRPYAEYESVIKSSTRSYYEPRLYEDKRLDDRIMAQNAQRRCPTLDKRFCT